MSAMKVLLLASPLVLALSTGPVSPEGLGPELSRASSTLQGSESNRVRGTRVSLVPPKGFTRAKLFVGFEHEETGSSIMILSMAAPIDNLLQGMTKENLAASGVELLSKSEVTRERVRGAQLLASQTAGGVEYSKCMFLVGNDTRSAMIVGAYPSSLESELGESLRAAIFEATFDPELELDPFDAVSFRVRSTEKLVVQPEGVGGVIVLVAPDAKTPGSPGDPLLVIAQSYSDVAIEDLEAFSIERARQTQYQTNIKVLESKPAKLSGMDSYELILSASDSKTKTPTRIYQVLAVAEDRYFVLQGMCAESKFDEFLPEFRRVKNSFTLAEEVKGSEE